MCIRFYPTVGAWRTVQEWTLVSDVTPETERAVVKIFQKNTFQVEFSDKNITIDRVRQIMIIWEKKKLKKVKMAAILLIFLSCDCALPRK